jgi:prepilin-type N-terminal cleavage/methylation domain-containing protein
MNGTGFCRFQQGRSGYIQQTRPTLKKLLSRKKSRNDENGFSLIELLIVITVSPLIIGALAFGLVAMFSLQSSVSNRLTDSGDAQSVGASFEPDVQAAQEVTTSTTAACGSGFQVIGLEWDLQTGQQSGGIYNTVVSYVEVPAGTKFNLVRQLCLSGSSTPSSSTIVSYNLATNSGANAPVVTICTVTPSSCSSAATSGWSPTTGVQSIDLTVNEPNTTETGGNYTYTLTGVPAATATVSDAGGPITITASTGCNFATAGSAPLAASLCFLDFSNLGSNPNLLADAETPGSCLSESVTLSSSWKMYFCLNISNSETGEIITPFALPTWCDGFLGNPGTSSACGTTGIFPNYYGVAGAPALYQQGTGGGVNDGYVTTITLSKIGIVNSSGVPATGWQLFGADAESTDNGGGATESITWSSAPNPLQVVSNAYTAATGYCGNLQPCDGATSPFDNACDGGKSWVTNGTTYYGIAANATSTQDYFTDSQGDAVTTNTIRCTVPPSGSPPSGGQGLGTALQGAAMVASLTPTTFTTVLGDGPGGLEAVVFGIVQ